MASNNNNNSDYEEKKKEIALALFAEALAFAKIDNAINNSFKELLENVVEYVKKNPEALASEKNEIKDLVNALKAKEGKDDIEGGDIVGGGIIQDIIDLVTGLSGVLKDEKDFFMDIIKLIFCGC